MGNVYQDLVERAQQLPSKLHELGINPEPLSDEDGSRRLTGWKLCKYAGGVSPSDYTNEFWLVVDDHGRLWDYSRSQSPEDSGTTRWGYQELEPVDAAQLHRWDSNGWDFAAMQHSILRLI